MVAAVRDAIESARLGMRMSKADIQTLSYGFDFRTARRREDMNEPGVPIDDTDSHPPEPKVVEKIKLCERHMGAMLLTSQDPCSGYCDHCRLEARVEHLEKLIDDDYIPHAKNLVLRGDRFKARVKELEKAVDLIYVEVKLAVVRLESE